MVPEATGTLKGSLKSLAPGTLESNTRDDVQSLLKVLDAPRSVLAPDCTSGDILAERQASGGRTDELLFNTICLHARYADHQPLSLMAPPLPIR